MARPSNTERRREQIARALLKVMARKGYDGASIANIAAAAHVAPGIVHYHFKDKQEILITALHDLVAEHATALDTKERAAGPDPKSKVAAFIDLHLGLGADANAETLACWVMLSAEALRQPKIRIEHERALASIASRLEAIIQEGVRGGAFRCESPAAASAALVATVQGYYVLAAVARTLIPRGSAAVATRLMADGLLRPGHSFSAPEHL